MLLSRTFVKNVLRNDEFGARLVSMVVDEAHVVSHWGQNFRKKYSELGIVRALVPSAVPVVMLSATLAPKVRRDVQRLLGVKREHEVLDVGNDRPNIAFAVRAMQHAANSFQDLAFVIPTKARASDSRPNDVPATWIFWDSINGGIELLTYLESLLPAHLRGKGLIRPFNAAMSQEYRSAVMDLFEKGMVRVLICTDAAGMVRTVCRRRVARLSICRDATSLMLRSLFNGSSPARCPRSCNALGGPPVGQACRALQSSLLNQPLLRRNCTCRRRHKSDMVQRRKDDRSRNARRMKEKRTLERTGYSAVNTTGNTTGSLMFPTLPSTLMPTMRAYSSSCRRVLAVAVCRARSTATRISVSTRFERSRYILTKTRSQTRTVLRHLQPRAPRPYPPRAEAEIETKAGR
jgi:hypothetical protein